MYITNYFFGCYIVVKCVKMKDTLMEEFVLSNQKPLLTAIEKYRKAGVYPFHTPGHKGGRGAEEELSALLGDKALAADVSLMSELDDIHHPTTCIKEAQKLAAEVYGADRSFFAPNGTTGAIHALVLGALQPGDKILIPRNAHRSVVGAVILAGLNPVYLVPAYDKEWSLSLQITADQVAKALEQDSAIKGVLITSPNYYGLAADVGAIAQVVHENAAVLLVDEAHGAHLGFTAKLPPSALQSGADGVAQSTHKILGALTQCSMLHIKGPRISGDRVAAAMSLVTTTSPNYLLLGSLDAARSQVADHGQELMGKAIAAATVLRQSLRSVRGIKVLGPEIVGRGGVAGLDVTKVTANVQGLGITGIVAGDLLRQAGIAVELVDPANILFLVTYGDGNEQFPEICRKVAATLDKAGKRKNELSAGEQDTTGHKCERITEGNLPPLPKAKLTPREAFFAQGEPIPFARSAGQISKEQISFYPPGIPILVPGEIITEEIIAYCQSMLALGLPISGPVSEDLATIEVITS